MGFFIAVLFILAVIALVKASTAQANAAGLLNRIDALERKLRNLENASRAAAFQAASTPPPVPVAKPQPDVPMEQVPFVPPPMSPRAGVQMESEPPVAEPAPAAQAFPKRRHLNRRLPRRRSHPMHHPRCRARQFPLPNPVTRSTGSNSWARNFSRGSAASRSSSVSRFSSIFLRP